MTEAADHQNAAWTAADARLAILIPFLNDDPAPLVQALLEEDVGDAVEIVLLDDGGGDARVTARLGSILDAAEAPMRLVSLAANEGRARGRNRLVAASRAPYLLFLDSDMLPDERDFVRTWLNVIQETRPAVAFGGFTLRQASREPRYRVHRAIAERSECVSADVRTRDPAKYVYTSNLLVRRDVFESEAFDDGFSGWGWEDVEWGQRVAARHPVSHVENPATHMGLDTVEALTRKYEQSTRNFARIVERHPGTVAHYPSYRIAGLLKRTPGLKRWRPVLRAAAGRSWLPVSLRALSLRLYRAALYADVV